MLPHAIAFKAHYFDGLISIGHHVDVSLVDNQLVLSSEHINKRIPIHSLTFSPPVGSTTAIITLHQGGELHVSDLHSYALFSKQLNPSSVEHIAHFFESHLHYTLAALLFICAVIFFGINDGLPALTRVIANHLPANFETALGEESLKNFDEALTTTPSTVPLPHQQQITDRLHDICSQYACPAYQLHFRASSSIGANAFALPSGDIVITDDLITLAKNNEEILAVLFHELGHVQYRHSLRLAIQNSLGAALLVVITGDIANITDFIADIPTLLMESGYQRDMEREADAHALAMLKASCISPKYYSDILTRLTKHSGEQIGLLSSHPDTTSRIQAFQTEITCRNYTPPPFCPLPTIIPVLTHKIA